MTHSSVLAPQYQSFFKALAGATSLLISPHVSPDGDGLGSMLGLAEFVTQAYPNITTLHTVISGKLPDVYAFMPGIEQVFNIDTDDQAQRLLPTYDMCISVDCGSLERLGLAKACFDAAKITINIDHHVSNHRFAQQNYVEVQAASTGEVIEAMLRAHDCALTPSMATNLYVTLMMDTGGFRFSNTTPAAFELAARLVAAGADPEACYKAIYECLPKAQAMLKAQAVLNTQFNTEGTLAWTVIRQSLFNELNALEEHAEGIIDGLRQIDTVKIAILFKETPEGTAKMSFRSNAACYDVSLLAGQFGGGGHKMASGASVDQPLAQVIPQVLTTAETALKA